ncbi:MAG: hypothetical protein IT521_04190 [Burkholderiales bacterium]|nr:hypothetical protein [Burkholderiales bacterium]
MKRLATLLPGVLALALHAPLFAQSEKSAPAADPATPVATAAVGYKTVEPKIVKDYPLPSSVDPRVCLEFPTRAQIIACAERYRPGKRRAG